jgi:hypothetical protein
LKARRNARGSANPTAAAIALNGSPSPTARIAWSRRTPSSTRW